MKKYEYVYVSLKIGGFFTSGGTEYRKIIDEYAKKGYRYTGYMPTKIESYGRFTEVDLIFEKEIDA